MWVCVRGRVRGRVPRGFAVEAKRLDDERIAKEEAEHKAREEQQRQRNAELERLAEVGWLAACPLPRDAKCGGHSLRAVLLLLLLLLALTLPPLRLCDLCVWCRRVRMTLRSVGGGQHASSTP